MDLSKLKELTKNIKEADTLMKNQEGLGSFFEVGKKYAIYTVTLYFQGTVVEKGANYVILDKDASWVLQTGELDQFFKSFKAEKSCETNRKIIVNLDGLITAMELD